MYNVLSIFVGSFITLMISLNGTLSNMLGNYAATVIVHFVGLIGVIGVLIYTKSKITFRRDIPLYVYSAGTIGVFTVLCSNLTFSTLGVSLTVALGLLGQTVASIIVDHYGLLGMKKVHFERKKYFGVLLVILGIGIMIFY